MIHSLPPGVGAADRPGPAWSRGGETGVVFPADLHDVLNEHDRDAVHDDVVRFLDRVQVTEPIS